MSFKVDTKVKVLSESSSRSFEPTEEQVTAKDLVVGNDMCAINAVSGSGKTSTFVYISSFLPSPSLYMTFNVTMAREASEKFGDHVSCMTTHSLAYRKVGKGYQHKLSRPHGKYVNVALTGSEVARFFRIPDFPVQNDTVISKTLIGLIIKTTVDSFEMSAEPTLGREHIPYHYIKDLDKRYGKLLNKKGLMKLVHRYAKSLWEERIDKYSEVCCKHNTYLKLYQLSSPDLSKEYEVIYLDEAQDLNPVTRDIILQQKDKCKLIFTGDRFQQIYAWNGSVNSLQSLECSTTTLTRSFRFGGKVAQLAELILDGEAEVNGFEAINTEVGLDVVDTSKPYTILFRTNMELIFTAVSMISKGDTINVNIDMKDFVAMLKSADALYKGDLKQVKHENVVPFSTWEELEEEGNSDRELGRLVSIVSDGNADTMIKVLHEHTNKGSAHITLTSAHKAKGLEYSQVILASDFPSNYNAKGEFVGLREEERNLLYVAVTRAMRALNINKTCQEFYDVRGIEIGSIPEKENRMDSSNKVQIVGSPKGEQAEDALQDVVQIESLRNAFANHTISDEDAFEYGFLDPLGVTTDVADFKEERILPFTERGLDSVLYTNMFGSNNKDVYQLERFLDYNITMQGSFEEGLPYYDNKGSLDWRFKL